MIGAMDLKKAGECLTHDGIVNAMRDELSTEDIHKFRGILQSMIDGIAAIPPDDRTPEQKESFHAYRTKLTQANAALLPANPKPVEGVKEAGESEYSLPAGGLEKRQGMRQEVMLKKYKVSLPGGTDDKKNEWVGVADSPQHAHDLARAHHRFIEDRKNNPKVEEKDESTSKRYFSTEQKAERATIKNTISRLSKRKRKDPKAIKQLSDRLDRMTPEWTPGASRSANLAAKKRLIESTRDYAAISGSPAAHINGTSKGKDGKVELFTVFNPEGESLPDVEVPISFGKPHERETEALRRASEVWKKLSELPGASKKAAGFKKQSEEQARAFEGAEPKVTIASQAKEHAKEGREDAKAYGAHEWDSWDHTRAVDAEGVNWSPAQQTPAEYRHDVRRYYEAVGSGNPVAAVGGLYDKKLNAVRAAQRGDRISPEDAKKQREEIKEDKDLAISEITKRLSKRSLDLEHKGYVRDAVAASTSGEHGVPSETLDYHGIDTKGEDKVKGKLSDIQRQLVQLTGSPLTREEQEDEDTKLKNSQDVVKHYFKRLRSDLSEGKGTGKRTHQTSHVPALTALRSEALHDAQSHPDKRARKRAQKTADDIGGLLSSGRHTTSFGALPEVPNEVFSGLESPHMAKEREGFTERKVGAREAKFLEAYLGKKLSHEMRYGDDDSELRREWSKKESDFLAKRGLGEDFLSKVNEEKPKGRKISLDEKEYISLKMKTLRPHVASLLGSEGSLDRDRNRIEYLGYEGGKGFGERKDFDPDLVPPKEHIDTAMRATGNLPGSREAAASAPTKLKDSDNDGLPDAVEGSEDNDQDGRLNFEDSDDYDAKGEDVVEPEPPEPSEPPTEEGRKVSSEHLMRPARARGQSGPTEKNMRVLQDWGDKLKIQLSKERDTILHKEGIPLGSTYESGDLTSSQKRLIKEYKKHYDSFIEDVIGHLSKESETFGSLPKISQHEFGEYLKKSIEGVEDMNIPTLGAGLFLNIALFKSLPIGFEQKKREFRDFDKDSGGVGPATMNIKSEDDEDDDDDRVKKSLNLGFYVRC